MFFLDVWSSHILFIISFPPFRKEYSSSSSCPNVVKWADSLYEKKSRINPFLLVSGLYCCTKGKFKSTSKLGKRGGGTLLLHQHSLTTRHTNIGWWELFIGEENGGIFDPAGEISSSSSSPLLFCSRRKERRLLYARTMTTTLTYLVSFEKPRNRRGGIYIIIIGWKSLTLPYSSSKLLLFHVFLLLL